MTNYENLPFSRRLLIFFFILICYDIIALWRNTPLRGSPFNTGTHYLAESSEAMQRRYVAQEHNIVTRFRTEYQTFGLKAHHIDHLTNMFISQIKRGTEN